MCLIIWRMAIIWEHARIDETNTRNVHDQRLLGESHKDYDPTHFVMMPDPPDLSIVIFSSSEILH